MWECGLKLLCITDRYRKVASLLMWECGLKQRTKEGLARRKASLLMWECGLKHTESGYYSRLCDVTPYVGVWIETPHPLRLLSLPASLLMWECGLKLSTAALAVLDACHSLCGSVD